MTVQTVTLHMYESTNFFNPGKKEVSGYDMRGIDSFMSGRIWLGTVDVEIDFPEVDTRQAQIDALEQRINKERAESQSRVNLMLEQISKLQALEFFGGDQ